MLNIGNGKDGPNYTSKCIVQIKSAQFYVETGHGGPGRFKTRRQIQKFTSNRVIVVLSRKSIYLSVQVLMIFLRVSRGKR